MIEYFNKLRAARREEGATAVEYGLMVAAIAAIIVGLVFAIGKFVEDGFNKTCDTLDANSTITQTGP